MKEKIGIIIQTRMGSTRLPGKVLMKLNKDMNVFDLLIKRLKTRLYKRSSINKIIVATTFMIDDKQITKRAEKHGLEWHISKPGNVLEQYYLAAQMYGLDIIIRITGDCPFVDPDEIDDLIYIFLNGDYDYVRNFDDKIHVRGTEIEIMSFDTLQRVYRYAYSSREKEHVTLYIYNHRELFKIGSFPMSILEKYKDLRLTIDVIEDLNMCKELYSLLIINGLDPIKFILNDILEIIDRYPELMDINKHIEQKKV